MISIYLLQKEHIPASVGCANVTIHINNILRKLQKAQKLLCSQLKVSSLQILLCK